MISNALINALIVNLKNILKWHTVFIILIHAHLKYLITIAMIVKKENMRALEVLHI